MFSSKNQFLTGAGGYKIQRSVRTRSSASGYFNRTPASASNRKTWTWSGWVKRGVLGADGMLFSAANGAARDYFGFYSTDQLTFDLRDAVDGRKTTTQLFRDPSAWYHVVLALDTTQATANNRISIYVNGVQVTAFANNSAPTQNYDGSINNTVAQNIARAASGGTALFDGYMTEVNFVDGQALTPSSFGQTDPVTGVWQPIKYTGTYGTNGFYLNFSDNSAATAAAIGKDYSGNGNNWTPNNISVTAGTTYDSMTDVPTLTSPTAANYPVWNPIKKTANNYTITNGNLQASDASASNTIVWATMYLPTSGKWYWEITNVTGSGITNVVGAGPESYADSTGTSATGFYRGNGQIQNAAGTNVTSGATYTSGDIIGVAVDVGAGTVQFYKNNVAQGATPSFTFTAGAVLVPFCAGDNTAGTKTYAANFGQQPFTYTPPTGFIALNTQNLPTPAISNGATVMAATLFTSTAAAGLTVSNAVNNVSFQPDLLWIKNRSSGTLWHNLFDALRGITVRISSNSDTGNATVTNGLTSFNSNGFTLGSDSAAAGTNSPAANSMVAWQWKAGNSSASNTSGSITSTVSVGATQGFSVVTYTGTGANATVGHGLGVAPKIIFVKKSSGTQAWSVYHSSLANTQYLVLNTTAAAATLASMWNSTSPTSSVFSVGTDGNVNTSTATYVAYCFSEVAGYSKIGSYTGNGSTDGPFVYCGFRPRFVLFKSSGGVASWRIIDTARELVNATQTELYPNLMSAESSAANGMDILSNGFKLRGSYAEWNTNGTTYIFMAFAENPFKNSLAR